jgi:hypothetical protein
VNERRSLSTLALGLVVVVLLLTWAVAGNRSAASEALSFTQTNSAMNRADHLCKKYAVEQGRDVGVGYGFSATNVAKLEQTAAAFGVSLGQWSKLPADHFVAECIYGVTRTTETTRCKDGSTGAVIHPNNFLVDGDGRAIPDPISNALPKSFQNDCV